MKLRAVVFDDDPTIREMLREICEIRGYEVYAFPDPKVCPLHIISRCPCPRGTKCADVIISDVQMPHVNGLDFIENLLQKGCKQPHIALISGDWSEADLARAGRLGCSIFAKPFQLSLMVHWLERVETMISKTRTLCNLQENLWFSQGDGPDFETPDVKKNRARGARL